MKKIKEFFVNFKKLIDKYHDIILFVLCCLFSMLLISLTVTYIYEDNNNNLETVSVCSSNKDYSTFTTVRAETVDISTVDTYTPSFDIIPLSNISFYSFTHFFKPVSALMLGVDYGSDNIVLYYPTIQNFSNNDIGYSSINLVSGANEILVACNSPSSNVSVVNYRVRISFINSRSFNDFANSFSRVDDYNYTFDILAYDDSFSSDLVGKFGSVNILEFGFFDLYFYNINYPSSTDFDVNIVDNYINVSHFVGYGDNYYFGYNVGFNAGESSAIVDKGLFDFLGDSVFNIFSVELFPGFPLYNLFLIGIGILTFGLLVKLFNW